MADPLAELWQQSRAAIAARMAVLEQAATASREQVLAADLRSRARGEAHKLAGLLGVLGQTEGSRLAQEAERLLGGEALLGPADTARLADLLVHLRQALDQAPGGTAAERATTAAATLADLPILAVDDDRQVLAVLRALLEPRGVHLTTLEDPRQFWPTLEQTQPALVLLDIEMPAVSGLELCHALRQHPQWRWLPIIVVSARQDPASVAQVRAAGAELLPKPVNGSHLLARIAAQVTSSGWDQAGPRQREGTDAVAPDRSATMPPAPTPTARAGLAPRGARILLADDDDSVAKVVATALGRAGHQVVRARTGAEALHLARHRPVDLILLDVQMPEGDGASVCRALRADPVLEQVPIILLSAQSDDATIRAGLAAGATDFLTKPFAIVQLRAHVDSWLRRAGADR